MQSGLLDRGINGFEIVGLHRDNDDFDVLAGSAANQLVIPNHFIDRERHILPRLKADDAFDLFRVHYGHLHEAYEGRLRRN